MMEITVIEAKKCLHVYGLCACSNNYLFLAGISTYYNHLEIEGK